MLKEAPQHVEREQGRDDRTQILNHVLQSKTLSASGASRQILKFIAEKSLAGEADQIKEYTIATQALGRPEDFDPRADNIVRVQVRQLRKKLEDYYRVEGISDPLRISIPLGHYHAEFHTVRDESGGPPHPEPAPTPQAQASPANPYRVMAQLLPWFLLSALSAVSLVLWTKNAELRRVATPTQNPLPPNEDVLWPRLFAPSQETSIVLADDSLVMLHSISGEEVPLEDYSGAAYADKMIKSVQDRNMQTALRVIADMQLTSLADANIGARLMEECRRYNGRCKIVYSRFLASREFRTGNFIFIGSRQSNPWVGLFDPQLNFYFEPDPKTQRFRIRNRSPLPGEQDYYGIRNRALLPGEKDYYRSFPTDKAVEESYSDLALLPNLTGTGNVLIISGLGMSDTEATGELITSPGFSTTLAKILNSKAGKTPAPYVEILFQFNEMSETARDSKIIAYRPVTPQKSGPP